MAADSTSFVLVIASLILWGSWANTYKIADHFYRALGQAEFELFFIGFSIAACCSSFLAIDAIGDSFWEERRWKQRHFVMALVAGSIANVGKVCITGAIGLTGMTVAIPLVLGIEIFLGTILLYVGDPKETNPWFLFAGVGLVLMAVMFDILYQLQKKEDWKDPQHGTALLYSDEAQSFGSVGGLSEDCSRSDGGGSYKPRLSHQRSDSVMRGFPGSDNGRCSTSEQRMRNAAIRAKMVKPKRGRRNGHSIDYTEDVISAEERNLESKIEIEMEIEIAESTIHGIFLAILSGLCLAIWPVIYEIDEGISWKEFFFGFILSLGLTSVITLPLCGWLRGTDFSKLHGVVLMLGMLGGMMMCSSYYLMFASQEGLTFIVSMTIVRCSPVIGAFWGIVLWNELRGASDTAIAYVALMFILYIAAIVLIALSVLTMKDDDQGNVLADNYLT